MLSIIKKWWKYSSYRFYYLNLKWNFNFWLKCTKEYKTIEYLKTPSLKQQFDQQFDYYNVKEKPELKRKKRFAGYKFHGKLYLDNPGLPITERDLWIKWKKKGLIK